MNNSLSSLLYPSKSRQSVHDEMVGRLALNLVLGGEPDVRADVPGYVQPAKIIWVATQQGHVPDLTTRTHVVEVETTESLGDSHTESQCRLFSKFAKEWGRKFVVVVPIGSRLLMSVYLYLWKLDAEVVEM